MSYKPIMAAPAAQTHKIKAPNNFPPDNLKEAYRKAILNTIDWSAIEIIKPDLYRKIIDVLEKLGFTLNPGAHLNRFDWNASMNADQHRDFTNSLYELIPSIEELTRVTGQREFILEYAQRDPRSGVLQNLIRAYFVRSVEYDDQEWLDKRRKDHEKKTFKDQRTLTAGGLGVDNQGYQSSQSSGKTTPENASKNLEIVPTTSMPPD